MFEFSRDPLHLTIRWALSNRHAIFLGRYLYQGQPKFILKYRKNSTPSQSY